MKKTYFSLYDIAVLSMLGALVFLLRVYLRIPMHLSGKSGIFWVVPIIIGIGVVNKLGAGTYIGIVSGALASFYGMGTADVFDIFKYVAMGASIDAASLFFRGSLDNILVGMIIGAAGNLSKMAVNYYIDTSLGLPEYYILAGIGLSSITHFIFGAAGGAIAAFILGRLYRSGVVNKDERSPG
jgi:hypothetical protein